jgi:hypothetical protein
VRQRELRTGFETRVSQSSTASPAEPSPLALAAAGDTASDDGTVAATTTALPGPLPLPVSVLRDLAVVFAADSIPLGAATPQLTYPALLADLDLQHLGVAIQVSGGWGGKAGGAHLQLCI